MTSKIKKKAMVEHNKVVKDTFERAKKGEIVDLTALFISKEKIEEME
ncbi:MAG: hypothetical protein ACREAE_04150 [Nitrosopumilaceae archaeon]